MKSNFKIIALFSAILAVLLYLTGCDFNEPHPVAYNRTNQIPADGFISQSMFRHIMETNDIGMFNGDNNGHTFQWLFFGSDITDPEDENLLINFTNFRTNQVQDALGTQYVQEFNFESLRDIHGTPSITINLNEAWQVDEVVVYNHDTGEIVADASFTNSPYAIVTFNPTDFNGLFYLVGLTHGDNDENSETAISSSGAVLGSNSTSVGAPLGSGGSLSVASGANSGGTSGAGGGGANRPTPTPPNHQQVNPEVTHSVTISISVATLLNNMDLLDTPLHPLVPSNGWIMAPRTVNFSEGENVFDVLQREVRSSGIHMVFRNVPGFNSVYIESIGNLGEFDAGSLSGWVYKVNGWGPNFGASQYVLSPGDVIEWHFTVDLGRDVGVFVGG